MRPLPAGTAERLLVKGSPVVAPVSLSAKTNEAFFPLVNITELSRIGGSLQGASELATLNLRSYVPGANVSGPSMEP